MTRGGLDHVPAAAIRAYRERVSCLVRSDATSRQRRATEARTCATPATSTRRSRRYGLPFPAEQWWRNGGGRAYARAGEVRRVRTGRVAQWRRHSIATPLVTALRESRPEPFATLCGRRRDPPGARSATVGGAAGAASAARCASPRSAAGSVRRSPDGGPGVRGEARRRCGSTRPKCWTLRSPARRRFRRNRSSRTEVHRVLGRPPIAQHRLGGMQCIGLSRMSEVCHRSAPHLERDRTLTSPFCDFPCISEASAALPGGGYIVGTIEKCQSNDTRPICSHLQQPAAPRLAIPGWALWTPAARPGT
jgi:hypothetical protein